LFFLGFRADWGFDERHKKKKGGGVNPENKKNRRASGYVPVLTDLKVYGTIYLDDGILSHLEDFVNCVCGGFGPTVWFSGGAFCHTQYI
jgi:hypothetical protein